MNDKILIFGGQRDFCSASVNVTVYDIAKNEFKELEPLPYGVYNMVTVRYKENVIQDSKNTVISYDIETQKSAELPAMGDFRSECCAIVDGNSLVVIGGKKSYNQRYIFQSVETFDFKSSKWRLLPSMNEARRACYVEIV